MAPAVLVDGSQRSFALSAMSIMFNPLFWNIVARQEYRNHFLTRIFGGNRQLACYFLAAVIFSLGLVRDYLYKTALEDQPSHPTLATPTASLIGWGLIITGQVLVLSSTWALGITGTFLGDYFGILMDHKIEGFPFNVTGAPMYYGSTLNFLGTALIYGKPAGVALTLLVLTVYRMALRFEDEFTARIYREAEERKRAEGRKAK